MTLRTRSVTKSVSRNLFDDKALHKHANLCSYNSVWFVLKTEADISPSKEGGHNMKSLMEIDNPLADELIRSEREEIEKYRWIESEKAGRDVGWSRASEEWKQKHFSGWKRSIGEGGVEPSLFEILWFQLKEIEAFKWIESEKNGRDIGWEQAVTEWQDRHYRGWKDHLERDNMPPVRSASRRRLEILVCYVLLPLAILHFGLALLQSAAGIDYADYICGHQVTYFPR